MSNEHLNEQQIARMEAIQSAASVLGRKSDGAFKAVTHPDTADLVDVAEYIIAGIHPLSRYREEKP